MKRSKPKTDNKCGTIDTDPDYVAFLERYEAEISGEAAAKGANTMSKQLEEIEAKEKGKRYLLLLSKLAVTVISFFQPPRTPR